MAWQTPTKKVSDVSAYVMRQFGDESGVQITDTDVIRWVNAAQTDIANTNDILKKTANLVLTADTNQYPLGTSMSIDTISSVRVQGVAIEFMNFNEYEMYVVNADPNRVQRGRPTIWSEWGGQMYLYPTPDSGYSMDVFFLGTPDAVTATTSLLALPDKYFQRIVDYVLAQAYELDENFSEHAAKMDQLDSKLIGMQQSENKGSVAVYPTITILPEDW